MGHHQVYRCARDGSPGGVSATGHLHPPLLSLRRPLYLSAQLTAFPRCLLRCDPNTETSPGLPCKPAAASLASSQAQRTLPPGCASLGAATIQTVCATACLFGCGLLPPRETSSGKAERLPFHSPSQRLMPHGPGAPADLNKWF